MLKAAAVEVDITPPVGVKMAGYGARLKASQGVHDPLKAQVFLLDVNDEKVVFICMDLIALQAQFVNKLRAAIRARIDIPEKHIMICCSHTHSGPQGFNLGNPIQDEETNETLQEIICQKIAGAGYWAQNQLQPAKLSLGRSLISGLGLNRNDPIKGAADQQVSIIRADDADGNPIVVLFNYGCHATVMSADNLLISADYPGAARATLKGLFPQTVFMFANSAAGDVSTRFTRRSSTFGEVTRFGQIMAAGVLEAMNVAEPLEVTSLDVRSTEVELPLKDFSNEAETQKELDDARETLKRLKAEGAPSGELRKVITKTEGAEIQLRQIQFFKGQTSMQAELQDIRVGPLHVVAVPGEPFSKTFLDIKASIEPINAILVGYANDYKGYFPESVLGLAPTYEDLASPFSSQAALTIKEAVIKLIKEN
jgi:neutral ceramidase